MDKASARRARLAGRQQDAKSNPLIIYETAKSKRQTASGKWQTVELKVQHVLVLDTESFSR